MGGLSLSKHTGGVLKGAGYESRIQEKGSGRHPLDVAAKERNGERSKTGSRVEHVCAQMEVVMGGKLTGCIGLAREKAWGISGERPKYQWRRGKR